MSKCQPFAYCLDPRPDGWDCTGCKGLPAIAGWKKSLAEKHWAKLQEFRKSLGGRSDTAGRRSVAGWREQVLLPVEGEEQQVDHPEGGVVRA